MYEQVAHELTLGEIKQGLWLKAIADSDGNEVKAKARYAKMRVAQIESEITDALNTYNQQQRKYANSVVADISRELGENNCAIGRNSNGTFTLFANDGTCTNYKTIDELILYYREHYA